VRHLFVKLQIIISLNVSEKGTVLDQNSLVSTCEHRNWKQAAPHSVEPFPAGFPRLVLFCALSDVKGTHTSPCFWFIYRIDEYYKDYSANVSVEHFGGRAFISHSVESRSPFSVWWSDSLQNSTLPQGNSFTKILEPINTRLTKVKKAVGLLLLSCSPPPSECWASSVESYA
jgi:hypothetical protein